jgi:glycosyltransferase involved in cell wall biosynthesis
VRVLITTVQVPFVRGGAEILTDGLRAALLGAGHDAEIVAVPFKWYPPERIPDQMLACRLFDLTESCGRSIDRVIGLKFPAYLIPHPNKVLWLLHQHRTAYDLWNHPLGDLDCHATGAQIRDAIRLADQSLIPEAGKVFTISQTVSARLQRFCGIDSTPLYHPPFGAALYTCAAARDYLFFPSRLDSIKRQDLVLEGLAQTHCPVRVVFAGAAADGVTAGRLADMARRLHVEDRVRWLGHLSEPEKRQAYAEALGVVFPPIGEDYGYVTLEAMLAGKAVITCADSGGPLEFVTHRLTGLIAEPTAAALAAAMDTLWDDRALAELLGQNGRRRYDSLDISWNKVVERLLA